MEWKAIVRDVAPALGKALGGPNAGAAVKYIAKELLDNPDASQEEVEAFVEAASPSNLVKLRKIDSKFKMQLEIADRADARQRDLTIIASKGNNFRADLLAILAVGGLVLCVWFIARDTAMPERAVNAIMFIAGILAAAVKDVYAYEFGSSRGSKEKDHTIARLK